MKSKYHQRKDWNRGGLVVPLSDSDRSRLFFFRVRALGSDGKIHVFDTATFNHPSLASAFASLSKCYPGAEISARSETDFADDGLPVVNVRAHYKVEKPKAYA